MYVERVLNRGSGGAILLRETWRDGKEIRNRMIATVSRWLVQQPGDLAVELAEAEEGVVAEPGQDPAFDEQIARLRLGFGVSTGLHIIR